MFYASNFVVLCSGCDCIQSLSVVLLMNHVALFCTLDFMLVCDACIVYLYDRVLKDQSY